MADTARRIFDDLLSLEVNVMVKPNMTARKMPELHHALLDVIGTYDEFLCQRSRTLNAHWNVADDAVIVRAAGPPPDRSNAGDDGMLRRPLRDTAVPGELGIGTIDELRQRAVEAESVYQFLAAGDAGLDDGDAVVLKRIYRNCDQIKGILSGAGVKPIVAQGITRESSGVSLPLTADEVLTVRKIWEVGVESVVMQTVAQLDGDVVTRVQRARLTAANAPLHALHRGMTESALDHWQVLFRTVVEITGKAFQGFLAR